MIFTLLTGVVAGLALGALGSAWGAITVPLLLISGMPPLVTKGAVLSSEVVVSGLGVASHAKLRNVKKELSMALILGIAGAILGSSLLARIAISGSAAAYYAARGYFTTTSTVLLIAGGMAGVLIGSYSTKFMKEEHMRKSMGFLVIALGTILLIKTWG